MLVFFLWRIKNICPVLNETKSFVGGNLAKLPTKQIGFEYIKNVFEIGTIQDYENY